jgi:KH/beta-lactamase-domain protein
LKGVAANNDSFEVIRKRIFSSVPSDAEIVGIDIEGASLVLLTKNPRFVTEGQDLASELAKALRKRIMLRVVPQARMQPQEAEKTIRSLSPRDVVINRVFFDELSGEVLVFVDSVIKLLPYYEKFEKDVLLKTGWKVVLRKKLPYDSRIYDMVLHYQLEQSEKRSKFLRSVGERVFRTPVLETQFVTASFFGGVEQVGRSSLLISTDESRVLLDAGINPGVTDPRLMFPRYDFNSFKVEDLDAIVVTHAHLDHAGALPMLVKYGYRGPIYMTEPTLTLLILLLEDLYNIYNKTGTISFFDLKDVRSIVERTITLKYGQVTDICPDIRLSLHRSGHILGGASVHLHIGESLHNVLYTSDFKMERSLLLDPANTKFPRVDSLLMESTYGDESDVMPPRSEVEATFISKVKKTFENGGKVLIPSLAVGRAQEVMLLLDKAIRSGQIEQVPIFIDGMIMEVTKIHIAFPQYLSRELYSLIYEEDINPFESEYFVPIKNSSTRDEAMSEGKAIIISTSGMLEGGPVLEYFKSIAPQDNSSIIFINYQIEGTLGSRILSGLKNVQFYDEDHRMSAVKVNCSVEKVDGFSGHADRTQLINYAKTVYEGKGPILLVHGEKNKIKSLSRILGKLYPNKVTIPRLLETSRLL